MRTVVAIMCGGAGTRFWPASVKKNPKQFLTIFKEKPLIMDSYNRATRITDEENIYMITTEHLKPKIQEIFPDMNVDNIIYEPAIRSTAPCLGLGALYLKEIDTDTIMVVLSADQIISDHRAFEKTIKKGIKFVKNKNALLTIGILPTFPETGFGYIKVKENIGTNASILKVDGFKEKPDLKTAARYVSSNNYFWNTGMFIWKIKDFLSELKTYSRETYSEIIRLEKPLKEKDLKGLEKVYEKLTINSIDYALMEKSPNIYVLPASFLWDDVGSWLAIEKFGKKLANGQGSAKTIISVNSEGNIIYAPTKLVATMDIKDLIIVDTEDTLMLLPKKKAQNVKVFLDIIKRKKLKKYL